MRISLSTSFRKLDLRLLALFALVVILSPTFFAGGLSRTSAVAVNKVAAPPLTLANIGTPPLPALNPFNPVSDYTLLAMEYDFMFSLNWPPLPEITPVMAGGYSSNANGSQWVISVRPDLKWDNGSPLNATDLYYTLNVYNLTGDFYPIISNMTILNSTSVQVDLAAPNLAFILTGFIDNGIAVLPSQSFSSMSFANLSSFMNLNNIVADGPYVFSNYTGQNPIQLVANPYYWNGAPPLSSINYEYYSSYSSEFNALIAGQISALFYPGAYNGLSAVSNVSGISILGPPYATPALTVAALLNDWVYPTNNTDFRRALAFGINTTLINEELNGPYANESISNQDFLLPAYNQQIGFNNGTGPVGYNYNVTEAKQLFQTAGFKYSGSTLEYPNGTAVSLTIKFRYPMEPYSQDVATILATQWQALGISVAEDNVPSATLRQGALNDSGWQVIATGVLGPQTDNGVTPGPGILNDIGDYYVNINGTHTDWNSTFYSLIQNMTNELPGSAQFNSTAQAAATLYTQGVPEIPLFNVFNWVPVSNQFYWGSASNNTGIYYTQAITGEIFWGLSLDAIGSVATSTSTTATTSIPPTSSTSSSSSNTSSTSIPPSTSSSSSVAPPSTSSSSSTPIVTTASTTTSSSSTLEYAAIGIVVVIIIIIAAVAMMRRRPSGTTAPPASTPSSSQT